MVRVEAMDWARVEIVRNRLGSRLLVGLGLRYDRVRFEVMYRVELREVRVGVKDRVSR